MVDVYILLMILGIFLWCAEAFNCAFICVWCARNIILYIANYIWCIFDSKYTF